MTRNPAQPGRPVQDETFLQRWSRRKLAAERDAGVAQPTQPAVEASRAPPAAPAANSAQPGRHAASAHDQASAQQTASAETSPPLPPIESLTFDSDFRAFLQPHVPEDLKREALKKLLHDPRFNVMDGLDVYIDDYSVPSPLEPALARSLAHARYIFEPPQTRVNAAGYVEDVAETEADTSSDGDGATTELAAEPRTADNDVAEDLATGNNVIGGCVTENLTTPPPSPAPLLDEEGKKAHSPPVKEGLDATTSRTGWLRATGSRTIGECPTEKHTTSAGAPLRERRGDAVTDFSAAGATSDNSDSDDPLPTRRGGTRGSADGVVGT
jgi:hypothetical protein